MEDKNFLEINFIHDNKKISFKYNKNDKFIQAIQKFCKEYNLEIRKYKFINKGNQVDFEERV